MQTSQTAQDSADAVRRFAASLHDRPHRIHARWNGADGVAALSAAERAIDALWPRDIAKELVWLTGAEMTLAPGLHLRATAADGQVLAAAAFDVGA